MKGKILCSLCDHVWTETRRERGSCPGCGASLNEILYRYTQFVERIEPKINRIFKRLPRDQQ